MFKPVTRVVGKMPRRAPIALAALTSSAALICYQLGSKSPEPAGALELKAPVVATTYPQRVYWGDTHLHTSISIDAFGFGARLGPEQALRFARGEEVISSTGIKAKLSRPLDFLVIADHADGFASFRDLYAAPRYKITDPTLRRWYDMMHEGPERSLAAFNEVADTIMRGARPKALDAFAIDKKRIRNAWEGNIAAIERYNQPGTFTAFHGFEYTLQTKGNNLHRNVIFRDGADRVRKVLPYAATSQNVPDKLWDYMEAYEQATGGKVLAIPHNSNLSNGMMFMMTDSKGGPMSADYARRRGEYEPLVEITQTKGDSESYPFLSPNDEFSGYGAAGWEIGNISLTAPTTNAMRGGNYVREALKRGLDIEQRTGINPYRVGVIGSTDSHTGLATADENNYFGKHPGAEPSPTRVEAPLNMGPNPGRFGWNYLSSGYAAVWATANTREAIFDAMLRREVYATTGPRITLRFFGGWDFGTPDLKGDWVQAGYARGVPMGGFLQKQKGKTPRFIVSALKDPKDGNLDRIQIVKGWVDASGVTHERVYDVAWSDAERRKSIGGKIPPVGDTVDTARATYTNTIGAAQLSAVWVDPEFNPKQRSFYYVRVLQIPTPTWMCFDKLRYGLKLDPKIPMHHQERAYTSAIWYKPANAG